MSGFGLRRGDHALLPTSDADILCLKWQFKMADRPADPEPSVPSGYDGLELVAVTLCELNDDEHTLLTSGSNRSHRHDPLSPSPARGNLIYHGDQDAQRDEHGLRAAWHATKAARRREACQGYSVAQLVGLLLGPVLGLGLSFVPLSQTHPKAQLMLGQVAWIVSWWLSLALPLPVTCLLPIVTFPLLGITPCAEISSVYFNAIIFLFIGAIIVDHGMCVAQHRLPHAYCLSSDDVAMVVEVAKGWLSCWLWGWRW